MYKSILNQSLWATALMAVLLIGCNQSKPAASEAVVDAVQEVKEHVAEFTSLDTEGSKVHWSGEMMGMYNHTGTVDISDATAEISNGKIVGGSFTIDLSTINPTDENYDAEKGSTPEKLVGHLSSADFFDVENFPTATFQITSVEGNAAKGMLTIRGNSHEETIENITYAPGQVSGDIVIDRKKYGVAFDHPVKEMVLSNNIAFDVRLKTSM